MECLGARTIALSVADQYHSDRAEPEIHYANPKTKDLAIFFVQDQSWKKPQHTGADSK